MTVIGEERPVRANSAYGYCWPIPVKRTEFFRLALRKEAAFVSVEWTHCGMTWRITSTIQEAILGNQTYMPGDTGSGTSPVSGGAIGNTHGWITFAAMLPQARQHELAEAA